MNLSAGEKKLGSWNLNLWLGESHFNGKLLITNQNVFYSIRFSMGGGLSGMAKHEGELMFSRDEIQKVETSGRYWIFKRFTIHLKDGRSFLFDRGILPVNGIVKLLM